MHNNRIFKLFVILPRSRQVMLAELRQLTGKTNQHIITELIAEEFAKVVGEVGKENGK